MVVLLLSLLSLLSLSLLCRLIIVLLPSLLFHIVSLVDVNTADDSDNGRIIVMITLESINRLETLHAQVSYF